MNATVEKKPAPTWAWVVGISILVLFIWALVAGQSPEEQAKQHERDTISFCWKEQARKSLPPDAARFAASTCEKMEADFQQKHGRPP
jgi:hypothetical protein